MNKSTKSDAFFAELPQNPKFLRFHLLHVVDA
jgi:hypothetical protein